MHSYRAFLSCFFLASLLCVAPGGEPFAAEGAAASAPANVGTDAYGDPLPPGALLRLGTVRWRACARYVGFTPDGKTLVAGEMNTNPVVRFWDTATGKEVGEYRPALNCYGFALEPDGKAMALNLVGEGGGIVVVSVPEGKELRRITNEYDFFRALCFSSDGGRLAAVTMNGVVQVWDAANGNEILRAQEEGDKGAHRSIYLALSPDGKKLAVSRQPSTLRILEVGTGKELFKQALGLKDNGAGTRVAFSPDGKKLLWMGEDEHSFALRDVSTGKAVRSFQVPDGPVRPVAVSPDGKYVAAESFADESPSLSLWDAATGKELRKAATSAEGYWVPYSILSGPPAFSSDSQRIAWSSDYDGVINMMDVKTGKNLGRIGEHQGIVCSVAFSPDGRTAFTGCADTVVRMWDADKGMLLRSVPVGGRNNFDYAIAFSADTSAAAVKGRHQSTEVWDLASGKPRARLGDGPESGFPPLFTPDGKAVATRRVGMRLWDAATGNEIAGIGTEGGGGGRSDFAPDGKTVVALRSDEPKPGIFATALVFYDAATGKELHKWPTNHAILSVRWSPDGRTIAAVGGDTINLWDAAGDGKRPSAPLPKGALKHDMILNLTFSRDGKTLGAAGANGVITLWEVATQKVRAVLTGHRNRIEALDFAPDGSRLISGSWDTTALIWDLTGVADDKEAKNLTSEKLAALWGELADEDAGKAWRAGWRLAADPAASVPFLQKHIRPAEADAAQIAKLLAALDGDTFEGREEASRELAKLGDLAEPAIRKTLERKPSLEARGRLEELLDKISGPVTAPEQMRGLRCVEALEHIGSPAARRLLAELGSGAEGARLTREAKAALERLDGGKGPRP